MTEEKLKVLLDNIDNLELIKRISEQEDFVIDSIISIFSDKNKKMHEKYNIRIDQIMYVLNSVTRLGNKYSKNTIINAINSEVFWANRSYSEAFKLFEIVENTSKEIELEVKRDAILNYKVLNCLNFEEH